MLKLLAQFIAYLLHPLLMPTWLFATMMFYFPASIQPTQAWILIIILIFGMTFILPLLNMLFFKMTGTIQNFQLQDRRDRVLPFIFVTIVYAGITIMIFWKMNFPLVFKLMVIITGLSVLATISTFFFKISVHALATGGMVGILLAFVTLLATFELMFPSICILILAGITMSSRLLLNAHNAKEVTWGGILGFIIGFMGVGFLF